MTRSRLARFFFALLALAALAHNAAAQKALRINLGTLAPRGSSYHQSLQTMGENWKNITNGGVKLVIFPDGNQGSESDMVRLMRVGTLQAALLTANGLGDIEPAVAGLQKMPLVFRDLEEFDAALNALRGKLEERLRAKGFEVLFWTDAGWVRFFSTEKALTLKDFSKHKIFVWDEPQQVEVMKTLGQTAVSLESNDIPAALSQGIITAIPMPPIAMLASQLDRKAGHMLDLNYAPLVGAAVISSKVWEKLPADQRDALRKAAAETGTLMRTRSRQESDEAVIAMEKRGLQVHKLDAAQFADWEAQVQKVYPKIRGNLVPADVFDEVQSVVQAHRAAKSAK